MIVGLIWADGLTVPLPDWLQDKSPLHRRHVPFISL